MGVVIGLGIVWLKSSLKGSKTRSQPPQTDSGEFDSADQSPHHPQITQRAGESRLEKLGKLINLAQASVEFYGKVVDQDGVLIPGVNVSWSVGKAGYFSSQPDSKGESSSDANGVFSILNQRGRALKVDSLKKEGYRESRGGNSSFGFGDTPDPHIPDPKSPVILLMVRDDLPKNLLSEIEGIHLNWNGEPNHIKLNDRDTQLNVIATRDRQPGQISGFTWNLDMSVAGGQIFELPTGAALLAPVDGYVEHIGFGFQANQAKWRAGGDKDFVFKTKDGNYGLLKINFHVNRENDEKSISVKSSINLSGHRNL